MTAPGVATVPNVDREILREAIQEEYEVVACEPERGFHFHTGRPLAEILGYQAEWLDGLPEGSIESFAGTGNPFNLGALAPGERVVDIGCGAGIDSLIAAGMVGAEGAVIGVDMTAAMLEKAQAGAGNLEHVDFLLGFGEELPVPDEYEVAQRPQCLCSVGRSLRSGERHQALLRFIETPIRRNSTYRSACDQCAVCAG